MPTGIIIIDKPQDWTSMDVCGKLRRLYGEKRVGHAGTLDPMATGVLPVFVGRATRAVEFAETGEKEYLAGLKLGLSTDTQDTTGQVLAERPVTCSRGDIEAVLDRFRGEIEQIPPMYSALKVNGQKLYQLARKGKTVERKPRSITIYQLELGEEIEENEYALRVKCSKGTYIRTLCQDIGDALGCGGCMSSLRRTMAAGFDLSQAVTMDRVIAAAENGTAGALLLPVDAYFHAYPALTITGDAERRCRNGNDFRSKGADGLYRVYNAGGEFLMLGERKNGVMRTKKSFFAV
ncbi:MAG: tRNA pseudouridine(55) synthase TruB [Oscillospiraceae bacterium]|nr:tRNA pseudouridine(55) synthase TruB [Oscillospiraceae bacterium]